MINGKTLNLTTILIITMFRLSRIHGFIHHRGARCLAGGSASSIPNFPSPSSLHSSPLSDNNEESVRNLLGSVLRRAQTTISDKNEVMSQEGGDTNDEDSRQPIDALLVPTASSSNGAAGLGQSATADASLGTTNLLQSTIRTAESTINANGSGNGRRRLSTSSSSSEPIAKFPKQSRRYNGNPAITNTALAQSLWSTILRPGIDSAIDATCGNGYDSVVLAKLLFGEKENEEDSIVPAADCRSQLLCLDVQRLACDNTTAALTAELGPELLDSASGQYVQVLCTSHAPLPRPNDSSSVALVAYNLGYLPNADNKAFVTQLDSTLHSIVDAMLMIRIGGMVSVVTYPKSNAQEDEGVRALLTCAALLSSKMTTWEEFLESTKETNTNMQDETRELVRESIKRVVAGGDAKQTWRVSEHKKLGMDRAPILVTATRIK